MNQPISFPKAFLSRRFHSLMGLWLVLFLVEHLFTNSLAGLMPPTNDSGFAGSVNFLGNIPYLHVIEIVLLGVPIVGHMIWGICYLREAKYNSFSTDGSKPSLKEYGSNRRYTWQRITSWILVVGIILHVIEMRFMNYPEEVLSLSGQRMEYLIPIEFDTGLYRLNSSMEFTIFDQQQLEEFKANSQKVIPTSGGLNVDYYDPQDLKRELESQSVARSQNWVDAVEEPPLEKTQVLISTPHFGVAVLLGLRDTFKDPWMCMLYTLFVLAAVYHACNGLWTFLITWGITLTKRSQQLALRFVMALMVLLSFFGLSAVWLTYWVNLN